MDSYIFSFINNKTWKMIFTVNVFADSVCVVFASPLTLLFALLCEHVSKTPEMFACSQIICDFRHACQNFHQKNSRICRHRLLF